MAPSQTLKWIDSGRGPAVENVEIEGSEPYIVGGHSASGYWVDTKRQTTLKGLFAAGDVVGGCPHKYVTGCFAEAEIAANSALKYIKDKEFETLDISSIEQKLNEVQRFFTNTSPLYTTEELEEAMQKVMDVYAGGISTGYAYNLKGLQIAKERIEELFTLAQRLRAEDTYQLMKIYELIDRLYVCKVLLHHLEARKETRWRAFQEFVDYPYKDDENFLKYVNSRFEDGQVKIIFRSLVKRMRYMSIRIDRQRCIGCGKCAEICPGNLIVIDEDKKAFVRDPRDCWGCAACVKECKFSAIRYFLGAEIGGNGTTMYVEKENDEIMYWYFEKPSGEKEMIVQNLKDNTTY